MQEFFLEKAKKSTSNEKRKEQYRGNAGREAIHDPTLANF
jgi:hypothetical protein